MSVRVPIALAIVLACAPAYAQHDHGGHEANVDVAKPFAATVALVAASFDTMLYLGNYQGVLPSARWGNSWLSAAVSGSAYRIERNGATYYGAGDVGVHTAANVVHIPSFDAGVAFAASAPTGNEQHGLGMGHFMLMPAVFAGGQLSRIHLGGSIGYSRALGAGSHADHGGGPIVSPMLPSEISWTAGADVMLVPHLTAGARGSGGIPAGNGGDARVVVGGRIAWQASRVESAFELQAGVAGDPFTVRGVVSTALSF